MWLDQLKPFCMPLIIVEPCPGPAGETVPQVTGPGHFLVTSVSKRLVPGHTALWLYLGTKIKLNGSSPAKSTAVSRGEQVWRAHVGSPPLLEFLLTTGTIVAFVCHKGRSSRE